MSLTFDPGVAAGLAISATVAIVTPLAAMVWLRRRFGAPWAAFGLGALTFVVSQFVLRLPWQLPLNAYLAKHYGGDQLVMGAWLAASALTAGLFEEGGRAVMYRTMWRDRSTLGGVSLGVGHGGIESITLIGVSLVSSLVIYVLLSRGLMTRIPAEVLPKVEAQFAALTFSTAILGGVERLAALMLHTGCSLLVLEYARGQGAKWLWLSIATHAGLNGVVLALVKLVGAWPAELALLMLAAGVLALAFRRSTQPR